MNEDRSYLYGDGLFETIRVPEPGFGGVRWVERHLARLRASGAALGFPPSVIEEGCEQLASIAAAEKSGIWRVTVSRPGVSEAGTVDWGGSGGVRVRHRPLVEISQPALGVASGYYLPDDILRIHKSTSFLRYVEARRRARGDGFDDAVLVSSDGLVGEATAASLFVVVGGEIVTPLLRGIVAGVTRAGLLELAAGKGVKILERDVYLRELHEADEIILVSAGVGAVSAASLMGRPLGCAWGERIRAWLSTDIDEVSVEEVISSSEKSRIVRDVLLGLRGFSGCSENAKNDIEDTEGLRLLAAKINRQVVGFVTLKETSEDTCEIHCIGVKKAFHRRGIGRKLHASFEDLARETYQYVQVKTVDEGYSREGDQTVAFYKSAGFKKLDVLPRFGVRQNPCLILIKKI